MISKFQVICSKILTVRTLWGLRNQCIKFEVENAQNKAEFMNWVKFASEKTLEVIRAHRVVMFM